MSESSANRWNGGSDLPTNFRSIVSAVAARGDLETSQADAERRWKLTESVCDRAERLAERNGFARLNAEQIADRIYGSAFLWLFAWRYRWLIWQIIRLIAELAIRHREEREALQRKYANG